MKSKDMKWEVDIKTVHLSSRYKEGKFEELNIEDGIYEYEISVLRKGNVHGHRSWGWDNVSGSINDKIVLFQCNHSHGYNELGRTEDDTVVTKERWEWAKIVAQQFCDGLNELEKVSSD